MLYTSEALTGGIVPIDVSVDISNVTKMAIEISFKVDEEIKVPASHYYCGLIDPVLLKEI
jgi:hypothetical protein